MLPKSGLKANLRYLLFPKNNQWRRRTALVLAFILFDYLSTLILCHAPIQEANSYARALMETFGTATGLTLFILIVSLPIYAVLTLDSHMIKLPFRMAVHAEMFIDITFAWYVAGSHFSGGASWFWYAPDCLRQSIGAAIYLAIALRFCTRFKGGS